LTGEGGVRVIVAEMISGKTLIDNGKGMCVKIKEEL
jgi:hypothetical protein